MTRAGVDQLLYMLDRAFAPIDDDVEHSLLHNLEAVTEDDFLRAAPNGNRTIVQITWHAAAAKLMYANHCFGDGTLTWDELFNHWEGKPSKTEMIDWLREAHAEFRGLIEPLDDGALTVERKAPWGAMHETRWIVAQIIEHDVYHAGEINLIRALLQDTDSRPTFDE
ncbi:MAG: DinB family protein [Chloroflexota bacterium]